MKILKLGINDFWKNIISVFNGALISQLIPIIGSVFIMRIYSPAVFGEFSSWLAIMTIVTVILTFQFQNTLAIVLDGLPRVKAVLYISILCFLLTIVISILMIIGKYVFSLERFIKLDYKLCFLLTPAAFFVTMNNLWQVWAAAEGAYRKLTILRVLQNSAQLLFQITIGLAAATAHSLAISVLIGSACVFLCSLGIMPKVFLLKNFNFSEFRLFFMRYKNFLIYGLPSSLINTTSTQIPVILIGHSFGSEASGYLALTMRVLGAPIALVGKAVLDVFKRYAAQSFKNLGNCRDLYIRVLLILSGASLVFIICTVLLSHQIFVLIFGQEWAVSGQMAIWLLPLFALRFVASPLSYIVYIVEKQHIDLVWQIFLLSMTYLTLTMAPSYKGALLWYSTGYAALYCVYLYMSYRLSLGKAK